MSSSVSSSAESHLATAKTALTAVASVAAAAMLARSVVQDYMPAEVHEFISCGIRKLFSYYGFQMTVVIEEFGGFEHNEVFEAAEAYLATKISHSTRRIKVNKLEKQSNFSVTVDRGEEVVDTFDGVKVTLSGLLNFVDGLWSSCGNERIIVFTTNYREKLDPTLLRPGRMDFHIHMSYCTPAAFKVLASNYLEIKDHILFEQIEEFILEIEVTPAEIAGQLMRNDSADIVLQGLIDCVLKSQEN